MSGNWGGYYGGGVFQGTLSNCTLTGNSAINYGGGASSSTLNNCIVYFNTAGNGPNYDSSCTLNYCCTMPLPGYGAGNISLDPQLASPSHLSASSPCRGAGNRAYASGADIDGEAWAIPPSTGCDEYHAGSLTGPLSVSASAGFAIVTMSFAVPLTGQIDGRPTASTWDFGDGVTLTNHPYASHAWTALGDYSVILRAFNESQPGGISATVTVHVVAQPVHYVAIASASPVAPYTSWATAATNIQDAVDAATVPGALVLVTNGIYATGGRTTIGDNTTDRVAVEKPLIVRSISGPQATTIDGSQWARCVYLTHGATLSGFTLTNGAGGGAEGGTLNDCTLSGNSLGAVSSTLNNCTVTGNSGWGAYDCTLNNCALTANSGTGAYSCRLNNCTLTGNSGGGAYSSTLNNCIVYFNQGANYDSSCTLNYCCASPPPTNGVGSISLDPQLASASHLSAASPCRGAGNAAYASGVDIDIDGEAWASPPSIGCDEYHAGAVTGPLNVGLAATFTNVAVGFGVELTALIQGRTTISVWEFGDGFVEINQPYATHAWEAPGDYLVALWSFNESHPEGVRATVTVHVVAGVHYVAANSGNPTAPYTSWATAATRIQDAINAAIEPGSLVLVTNGIYAPIDARGLLTVRSVNGPQVTGISGGGLVRCARLAGAASLSGFTLNHGHAIFGGGVYCETKAAVVSNCVVSGNSAYFYGAGSFGETAYGGGAYGGTLNNCALSGNSAGRYRFGARGPVNQVGGGGAYNSTLNNCTLTGNSAIGDYYSYSYWTRCGGGGGGLDPGNVWCHYTISAGTIANGGAAYGCILNNCTLAGNSASQSGGGSSSSTLNNCIILDGSSGSSLNSCWTTDPLFVAGNLRLQSNSPCINAGNNAYAPGSTDLDGRPRIVGGTVDIGAYEFQPDISGAFIGYLQQYGLPTDGSADITDSDGDGMDNRQEWIAGTNPTDATSLLRLLVPVATPTGLFLRWNGDTNHAYFIERTTALKPPLTFSLLRSNVPGLFGTTTFTDTTAPSNGAAFYRIGTDSTNGSSSLWLQTPVFVPASVVVIWTSVANRSYFIERATNLAAPMLFTPLATSIPGQTGTTIYADTNAIGSGPFFYRVGVSTP